MDTFAIFPNFQHDALRIRRGATARNANREVVVVLTDFSIGPEWFGNNLDTEVPAPSVTDDATITKSAYLGSTVAATLCHESTLTHVSILSACA